jgi:predicted nucleotidyltransferase component of viral defense system
MNRAYFDSVQLLLDAAPAVFSGGLFALKGGTAINLFIRGLPRLSVDLDLVYTDQRSTREQALVAISGELKEARKRIEAVGIDSRFGGSEAEESKLLLQRSGVRVKIEVNHIFRGTLLDTVERPLVQEAQDLFFSELKLPVLNKHELYASKLVAAMDRQHPRDLFDVIGLYENEGLTDTIVECFAGYLAGHNRPVHEVLFARELDIQQAYENEFKGMTREPVELERLLEVRERLFRELPRALNESHRSFLMGLVAVEPDWSQMPFPHLCEMPAVRWKLQNLERLRSGNPAKFEEQSDQLHAAFERMDAGL